MAWLSALYQRALRATRCLRGSVLKLLKVEMGFSSSVILPGSTNTAAFIFVDMAPFSPANQLNLPTTLR
jgi:hypothetical protein